VVFAATEDFKPSKANRARVRAFAEHIAGKLKRPVFDLPAWSRKEAANTLSELDVCVAFDPLTDEPEPKCRFAYGRMAGPSGYKSRYDAASLDRVVELCKKSSAQQLFVAFRNIDRYENSKYVRSRLS
jgi:uncharacterized protein YecE (DUF72 family)